MLDASSAIVTLCHRRTQAAQEQSFDIVSQEQGFVTIQIGATSTLARFLATMRLPVEQGNNTHIQKQQNVETHKYAYTATTQMQRYVTRRKSHAAQKPTTCRKNSDFAQARNPVFKIFILKCSNCSKCSKCSNVQNVFKLAILSSFRAAANFPNLKIFSSVLIFHLVHMSSSAFIHCCQQ